MSEEKITHRCSKEKEITELKTNGEWVMLKVEKIEVKLDKVYDDVNDVKNILTRGDGKISVLNKEVFGSVSKAGLKQKLENVESMMSQFSAIIKFVKYMIAVSGLNLFAIIVLIINLYIG